MSSRRSDAAAPAHRSATVVHAAALVALALLGTGCLSIELPPEFLRIDRTWGSEIKAVTPDDARLWVRDFDDRDKGDLGFWSRTLEADLASNRGYTLIEKRDVTKREGGAGVELTFEVTAQGAARGYLVAVFVVEGWLGNTIQVVELTAEKAAFARRLDAVRAAIATLRP